MIYWLLVKADIVRWCLIGLVVFGVFLMVFLWCFGWFVWVIHRHRLSHRLGGRYELICLKKDVCMLWYLYVISIATRVFLWSWSTRVINENWVWCWCLTVFTNFCVLALWVCGVCVVFPLQNKYGGMIFRLFLWKLVRCWLPNVW